MHTLISYRDVTFTGGFWAALQERNRLATMSAVEARFRETGRFDAFRCKTAWPEGKKPHIFWDSDVAKWMESAAYILQKRADPALESAVEELIGLIEKNQGDDGYFNIYFTVVEPENRWQNRHAHELYCAGHLIEAAVAWREATGRDRFLNCMLKYAAYIEKVFMREGSAEFRTPGHEEIELALVKLWRCTGDERWLRLGEWFVERRGSGEEPFDDEYMQSHAPVREQRTAEGHAVRAMYLCCAMADLALVRGDAGLRAACEALFENVTQKRMYVTGGIGSTPSGERFTFDYDLPNETAYAETCAAIGLALFSRRMSLLEPDARYADAAERAVCNGFLSGVSEDGRSFFYENPLEINFGTRKRGGRFPITQRKEVFDCSCCPPNVTRFIASFGDFLFSRDGDTLYVHHYASAAAPGIGMTTEYPADGHIALRLRNMAGKRVALRIPGWCEAFHCDAEGLLDRGYYRVDIRSDDYTLGLTLEMPARLVYAHPDVQENIGRAAVMRGPVVYCLEGVDNGGNLRALAIPANAAFTGGFDALECEGYRLEGTDALYSPAPPKRVPQRLKFIPYHRFANRGESEMMVWVKAEGG